MVSNFIVRGQIDKLINSNLFIESPDAPTNIENDLPYIQNDLPYIQKQAALFDQFKTEFKTELLDNFKDKYVYFKDGKVLDSSEQEAELAIRLYRKYGMQPFFIEFVSSDDQENPKVWTPFPTSQS